jgi:hypothetical protein
VPSGSLALTTRVFAPSRNVTGAVTTRDLGAVRSVCWWTSTPFTATVTLATPWLEVMIAARTAAASVSRARSSGDRMVTVKGTGFA